MIEPTLVPFHPVHLQSFAPGSHDLRAMTPDNIERLIKYWPGKAVSGVLGGKTLGIAGAALEGGRAIAWMVLSDQFRERYPVFLQRMAKSCMRDLVALDKATTIEVLVHQDFSASRKWIERLGFNAVGQIKQLIRYEKHG